VIIREDFFPDVLALKEVEFGLRVVCLSQVEAA
jgi:hypothetical protein